MKINRVINWVFVFSLVVLSACSMTAPARMISDRSSDPDPLIYISILDSIEQALSLSINGDDLHSHQLDTARRQGIGNPVAQSSRYAHMNSTLCGSMQTREDWSNMACRALNAMDKTGVPCQSSARCVNFRLAPFVAHDEKLMAVVASAASNPCRFIPDPAGLKQRHHSRDPRGPATMHSPDVSRYWLSCDMPHAVQGVIEPGKADGEFAIRWSRSLQ